MKRPSPWREVLLGRPVRPHAARPFAHMTLIVAWHYTVFTGTLAVVDWWLAYGAAGIGMPANVPFDPVRSFRYVTDWFFAGVLLPTIVLIEGLLAAIAFVIVTRQRWPAHVFVRLWWRLCLIGIVLVPAGSIAFASTSTNYDLVMNFPLLWVPFVVIGMVVLVVRGTPYPHGCCQHCGYNLTGNLSGTCPECGSEARP